MARAHDDHGVLAVVSNETVDVADEEVQARGSAPVAHQTVLHIFAGEGLLHQRVGTQINLADGKVVGNAPVLVTPSRASSETGAFSFFQGVPITGLVMCTPVLLHVIVRLIISVRSRSLTLAVPSFPFPINRHGTRTTRLLNDFLRVCSKLLRIFQYLCGSTDRLSTLVFQHTFSKQRKHAEIQHLARTAHVRFPMFEIGVLSVYRHVVCSICAHSLCVSALSP